MDLEFLPIWKSKKRIAGIYNTVRMFLILIIEGARLRDAIEWSRM